MSYLKLKNLIRILYIHTIPLEANKLKNLPSNIARNIYNTVTVKHNTHLKIVNYYIGPATRLSTTTAATQMRLSGTSRLPRSLHETHTSAPYISRVI